MLLVALALWLPFSALVGYLALRTREGEIAAATHALHDKAHAIAVAADATFGAYTAVLSSLARSDLLAEPFDRSAFERRAHEAGAALRGLIALNGPPPDNALLATTSPDPERLRQRIASGWMREAMAPAIDRIYGTQQPAISDLFIAPVLERPLLAIGVPVPGDSPPGRRLSITVDPAALQEMLQNLSLPEGAVVVIRDSHDRVVASSNGLRPGQRDAGLDWIRREAAGRTEAVVHGRDASGNAVAVAIEGLRHAPGWTVLVVEDCFRRRLSVVHDLVVPIGGTALAVVGIVAVAWASRREAERRMREEAGTLQAAQRLVDELHQSLPAVIYLREFTPDGRPATLHYHAGDLEGVTGWTHAALGDRFIGDLADSPEAVRGFIRRFLDEGEAGLDWRMRQPDGGERWLRWRARRLRQLPNGNHLIVGYNIDITAARAAEARASIAGRLATMAELGSGLAHELKQPLQVITLAAEAAEIEAGRLATAPDLPPARGRSAAAVANALAGIVHQATRTGEIIEHLRRFARGSAEAAPNAPMALDAAVDGAMLLVGHGLRQAGISVEIALGDPPPIIIGQPIALEQILVNLLNNARDALIEGCDEAARRIRIAATPADDGRSVLLSVADTGGGLPPHVLARLFQPFVTTKGVESGTGLGLSLCKSLALGMGAAIDAHNDAAGAVFTLRLPAAPVEAMAAEASAMVDAPLR